MRATTSVIAILTLALGSHVGCGGEYLSGFEGYGAGGPGSGVTAGGAQDFDYVREIILSGGVPGADSILAEGLFSEHDLATSGEPCDELLCLRPAVGIGPHLASGAMVPWVHVGMSSGLPEDLVRPPLDVVVLIDKSSSMAVDMAETTTAVNQFLSKLRRGDRVEVVAFDDGTRVIHPFGPVADLDGLQAQVSSVRAGGGWDIATATARALATLRSASDADRRLRRVVVLSCGYPTIDDDLSDAYSQAVLDAGFDGIGFSFFGVLLGYSANLAELLGTARGGNYYYLSSLEETETAFDKDLTQMLLPLAYDLGLAVDLDGAEVAAGYGMPGRGELHVGTVFPSRRRGGMALRLNRVPTGAASIALSYTGEPALGLSGDGDVAALDFASLGAGPLYQSNGVRKIAALSNTAEQMAAACAAYHDDLRADGIAILDELIVYLDDERQELASLGEVRELVARLRDNMR